MRTFNTHTLWIASLLALAPLAHAQDAAPTPPQNMVFVPSGEFQMGTNQSDGTDDNQGTNTPLANNDARPEHAEKTKAFFLDKTEVTNAQYKAFCDATNYPPPPQWKDGHFPDGQANFAVTRVSWYEATAYAKWAGKRLPTEAEWEHAARGVDGRSYPWGNDWDEGKVVWGNGAGEVGSKPAGASPYGALDMAGNAAEWTSSWFDAYANAPTKQPDLNKKTYKVARGGPGYGGNSLAFTFYRMVCKPDSRNMWIGFRCAKDVSSDK